jgi:hypothetical protein
MMDGAVLVVVMVVMMVLMCGGMIAGAGWGILRRRRSQASCRPSHQRSRTQHVTARHRGRV